MSNLQEYSAEQLGAKREAIDAACHAAGLADGQIVVVMGEEGLCLYRYSAPAGAVAESNAIPNCSATLCLQVREALHNYCQAKGFPLGTAVPIYSPDGSVCYCYCS